jgi:hypothetical protein
LLQCVVDGRGDRYAVADAAAVEDCPGRRPHVGEAQLDVVARELAAQLVDGVGGLD